VIDPSVGLTMIRARGERVRRGEPIARLLLARANPEAVKRAAACFRIEADPPQLPPGDLVLERVE